MRIIALDLSLTRSGWAGPFLRLSGVLVPPRGQDRGMARLRWIRDQVIAKCAGADVVAIEGYAYGSARGASQQHSLGELGGVVRLALFEAGIHYVDVAPATLKKFATGKGNANKELMLAESIRRLGYSGSDSNEADALWMLNLMLTLHGQPEAVAVPKVHMDAIAKLKGAA